MFGWRFVSVVLWKNCSLCLPVRSLSNRILNIALVLGREFYLIYTLEAPISN